MDNATIKLVRVAEGKNSTLSHLYIDGLFQCYLLEDRIREEKIQGLTCIPEGEYGLSLNHWSGMNARYAKRYAGLHEGMVEMLKEQRLPGFWHQGIRFCAPEEVRGMYGSGLAIMNLPDAAREALDALPKLFSHLVTLRKGTGYVAG